MTKEITLTDLPGLTVGHCADPAAGTGCTVVLAPDGVAASGRTPGFAPGGRETELLRPENLVQKIHGLCLAGGSAFGLAAASGVVRFLREKGAGFDAGQVKVPLVPAAVIFDYPGNKSGGALPDESMGLLAARAASSAPVASGPLGAGLSASCGKIGGPGLSSPSGVGSYGQEIGGVRMAALVVVNPLGSIVDPRTGRIVSGLRAASGALSSPEEILEAMNGPPAGEGAFPGNTVLAVVATDAPLTKLGLHRLALMAASGIARAVYPSNTMLDGDTVFALSTRTGPAADASWLGALAADAVSRAILNSVPAGTSAPPA
jgi:L-aminopeptidase/D-esterase-like protein